MKSARDIGKARNARLNQTLKHAQSLQDMVLRVQGTPHDQLVDDGDFWEELRDLTQSISQCVHEANAYNNVLLPEGRAGMSRTTYEVRGT